MDTKKKIKREREREREFFSHCITMYVCIKVIHYLFVDYFFIFLPISLQSWDSLGSCCRLGKLAILAPLGACSTIVYIRKKNYIYLYSNFLIYRYQYRRMAGNGIIPHLSRACCCSIRVNLAFERFIFLFPASFDLRGGGVAVSPPFDDFDLLASQKGAGAA